MKLTVQNMKLAFVLLTLLGCTQVRAQPFNRVLLGQRPTLNSSRQLKQALVFATPSPPPDIGQPGRRSKAGTRGCEGTNMQFASSQEKHLTALVPAYRAANAELVWGLTTAEHPTFWFYVPYKPLSSGEFVLRDKDGNLVYKTQVTLSKTPGVVIFSLPSTAAMLEVGKRYHWYFKIYCQPEPPPLFVDGWIQRVSPNSALESQLQKATLEQKVALYASYGIWYEALAASAELRRRNPHDPHWAALLQAVGLDDIASEPMAECCQPRN